MVRKRYAVEQIIGVLKESEAGAKTGELCRKHGMSEATFYKWKAKYAGLTVNELKRLRSLEEENRRLKQIVAQQTLDNWALKELLAKLLKPKMSKMAVTYATESLGLSERKACQLTSISPSVYRYRSMRGDDGALRLRMRELAGE